jgi:hypothetical protein
MGFDTPEKLKAFIERNRMIYQDYKDLQKANEIYSKNNLINSQIASYESSHYTNERQMEFSLAAFLIAFSLLFLFRYIHYGIKWSVRTLKE